MPLWNEQPCGDRTNCRRISAGGQNVVAPGEARLDAEGAAGLDDHTLLPVQIVLRRGQAEREIQISHIVIHSAAAGEAAGELPAVLLQKRRAALLQAF